MATAKQTICFVCVCTVLALALCFSDEEYFIKFIEVYNKTYNETEYSFRLRIFKETLKRIRILNKGHGGSTELPYGVTKYADLTPDEFRSKVLQKENEDGYSHKIKSNQLRRKRRALNRSSLSALPQKVDWRDNNVINPVQNQGECGACWAFSTVETLESMYAIRTNRLPILSVQQVIDCADNGNYGCQGGDTCFALLWMNSTKVHLVPSNVYPFTRQTGICRHFNESSGIQVGGFSCEEYVNREYVMVQLLATHGPLVVAVDATMWQDYLGGIIRFHCETSHNHAVQIVGYDLTGSVPYYIIRNSWGTDFGINGYLYVEIGKNLCGIANEVSSVNPII